MEIFLIKALQLILSLGLLVLLHEGGHFLFAKLFKVRVEKFCLFFDPWFTLAKFKPKKSDTTYALGWLPLGGYVKIAGMIDESMDLEQLKQPVQPWEFRSKPAWQRLFIMIGGVLVNFLLAFFIYAMILFTWGETYIPQQSMSHGFKFNERAVQLGFRDGDIPLRTNDAVFERYDNRALTDMYRSLSEATSVTVLREGKEVEFSLPGDVNLLEMIKEVPPFAMPLVPSVIDSIAPNSPAAIAGLHTGDLITSVNGTEMTTVNEYQDIRSRMNDVLIQGNPADSLRLRNITLTVQRAGTATIDTISFQLNPDFTMGIVWNNLANEYKTVTQHYGFFESFPAGIKYGWNVLCGYVSDLQYLFTKDGAQSVGSFGAIGNLFPSTWQWQQFWSLTAFFSLMLAFMNILPIPALDGGHVLFLLYEVVTRRKPSEKFLERAQTIGMTLLLILMSYAIFNDIMNFVF